MGMTSAVNISCRWAVTLENDRHHLIRKVNGGCRVDMGFVGNPLERRRGIERSDSITRVFFYHL